MKGTLYHRDGSTVTGEIRTDCCAGGFCVGTKHFDQYEINSVAWDWTDPATHDTLLYGALDRRVRN